MPAWPLAAGYSKGLLGYSQRTRGSGTARRGEGGRAGFREKIAANDLAAIVNDPELLRFALAGGEAGLPRPVTAAARKARSAIRICTTRIPGYGATARSNAIHQDHPQRHSRNADNQMPAFGRSGVCRSLVADVASRALALRHGRRPDGGRARGEGLGGQLHAVSRSRGQGEIRHSAPPTSPIRFGSMQARRDGNHPQWPRRGDANLGPPPRSGSKELAIYVHSLGGSR